MAFAVNGNGIRSASLRVNGIEIARTNEVPNSTMQATILVSTERAFNVNDKITLVIFQTPVDLLEFTQATVSSYLSASLWALVE